MSVLLVCTANAGCGATPRTSNKTNSEKDSNKAYVAFKGLTAELKLDPGREKGRVLSLKG